MTRRQPIVALVRVYQCPTHPRFTTLVLDIHGERTTSTRFGTSKCCPKQYAKEVKSWGLDADEAREFAEQLQEAAERTDS